MRPPGNLFTEALYEARFADAGLADDQHHLTFTLERAIPSIHQRAQFVLAPDERGQATGRSRRVETPARSARLDDPINLDRTLDTLERLRATILDYEQARDQPMRGVGDCDGARFGGGVYARRDIGRIAEDVGFLAGARAYYHRA
jgi:hypothetical protein